MPTVLMLPERERFECADNQTLLQSALERGVALMHACGGQAKCSTCRVVIESGEVQPPEAEELAIEGRLGMDCCVRLGCRLVPRTEVTVRRLVLDDLDRKLIVSALERGVPEAAGEEREVAVLFCDLRGFTRLSRQLLPYDVIHVLQRFFHQAQEEIEAQRGYIQNTMGDGFLAVFSGDEGSGQAVAAGKALVEMMERDHGYWDKMMGEPLRIGVGIHQGAAICGSIGVGEERRPMLIGDTVNVASRIETATKEAGVPLLISESIWRSLPDPENWEERTGLSFPGIENPPRIFSMGKFEKSV